MSWAQDSFRWIIILIVLSGVSISVAIAIVLILEGEESRSTTRTPTRTSSTFPTPESDTTRLERVTREASSLVRWIESNTDSLARCVSSGKIDWSLYESRLRLFATILTESGKDAMDGRLDSYSIYEIERNVDGARQTVSELKSKCGIR